MKIDEIVYEIFSFFTARLSISPNPVATAAFIVFGSPLAAIAPGVFRILLGLLPIVRWG